MAVERVADMTLEELKGLIRREVDERWDEFQRVEDLLKLPKDNRTLDELLASIDQHRFVPPPGTPSTLELLREDRDR